MGPKLDKYYHRLGVFIMATTATSGTQSIDELICELFTHEQVQWTLDIIAAWMTTNPNYLDLSINEMYVKLLEQEQDHLRIRHCLTCCETFPHDGLYKHLRLLRPHWYGQIRFHDEVRQVENCVRDHPDAALCRVTLLRTGMAMKTATLMRLGVMGARQVHRILGNLYRACLIRPNRVLPQTL